MTMILGIGNDIIEIERIKNNIDQYGERFLDRIFTKQEQTYCFNRKEFALHFAGRFAAKEAVAKALGTGFADGLTWVDIEILNDSKGKPYVAPSAKLMLLFNHPSLLISISHCRSYATAMAIWCQ